MQPVLHQILSGTAENIADTLQVCLDSGAKRCCCPFCGGDVIKGKYGIYCKKKCGMRFGKIMGKQPMESQWKDIPAGKRILLKGLKSKSKDSTYDVYFIPEIIEDYNYTDKDNKKHYGKQFRFKMEFPQKKNSFLNFFVFLQIIHRKITSVVV